MKIRLSQRDYQLYTAGVGRGLADGLQRAAGEMRRAVKQISAASEKKEIDGFVILSTMTSIADQFDTLQEQIRGETKRTLSAALSDRKTPRARLRDRLHGAIIGIKRIFRPGG